MANSSPAEALPDVLNDSTLRDYQAKLTELKRQIAELHATYTDESPKVQKVQVQFATLETALSTERADILKRIKNEYDEALRRESLLTADYAAQRATVTGESGKAVQYDIMKHEVESNRQLYDAMLQQLKQATLASALRASNMRVVDPAKLPKRPYKPDIPISTALGLLTGVFLGAAFVIMQERADRSIQEPGETQFFLNLPELGIVPAETAGGRLRIRYTGGTNGGKGAQLMAAPPEENSATRPALPARVELATWQRKPSVVAESFRAILVSILFSGENGSRPRVMVVTSANPSEGKSTVVSNLGIAVAEVNQKVLLDRRRSPQAPFARRFQSQERQRAERSAALQGNRLRGAGGRHSANPCLRPVRSDQRLHDLGGHQPALLQPHAGAVSRNSAPSSRPSSSTRRPCSRFPMPGSLAEWWIE